MLRHVVKSKAWQADNRCGGRSVGFSNQSIRRIGSPTFQNPNVMMFLSNSSLKLTTNAVYLSAEEYKNRNRNRNGPQPSGLRVFACPILPAPCSCKK